MKVCIVTTEYSLATNLALAELLKNKALKKNGIEIISVVSTNHVNALTYNAWRKFGTFIKKSGLKFTLKCIGLNAWQKINLKINRIFIPVKKRKIFEVQELCKQANIEYLVLESVNGAPFKNHLTDHQVDLLVSCLLLEKVSEEVLNIPGLGGINFHPGIFSEHRGTFSGFWARLNPRKTAGATVHTMTKNFDEGTVISQRSFRVKPLDSMNCLNEHSAKIGGRLLAKTLVKIKKKQVRAQKIKKLSPLLSMPNSAQVNLFTKYYYLMRAKDWWRL